jgi:hypothetical protein
MKLLCLTSIVLLAVVAQPAGREQPQELLTKGQVMDSVKAEMKPLEMVKLNHDRRINFVLSDEYLLALRTVGAQEGHSDVARHPAQAAEQRASIVLCRELSMSLRKARRAVTLGEPMAAEVAAHGKIEGAFSVPWRDSPASGDSLAQLPRFSVPDAVFSIT